jgi:pathogenesis-related protein 1
VRLATRGKDRPVTRLPLAVGALLAALSASGLAQDRPAASQGQSTGTRPAAQSPRSSATAATTGSAITTAEANALVEYHNRVRREVGVGPLQWSAALARVAQDWANRLGQSGKLEHRPDEGPLATPYGENLAFDATVLKGAEMWYSEIGSYAKGTPIPEDFYSFKAGHYTQMVWRGTQRVGCGKSTVVRGEYEGLVTLVCNYDPPGNVLGQKPY